MLIGWLSFYNFVFLPRSLVQMGKISGSKKIIYYFTQPEFIKRQHDIFER